MKKVLGLIVTVSVIAALGFVAGCDWEDSDDFNTARGAGASVNLSGVYVGRSGGNLLTREGAEASVSRLVLTHIGNTVEIRDNNNSYYTGNIGAPGVVSAPSGDTGTYPAGAEMLQAQINFTGRNEDSGSDIEFVGIVRAVAVSEVTSVDRTITIQDQELDQTSQYQFNLTEANTRYVIEGNWVEGGQVFALSAEGRAVGGTFTTAAPAATP